MHAAEVLAVLHTSRDGLSSDEAVQRRSEPEVPAPSFWRALREELANPLTPILGAGAAASAAVGSVADAVMVAAVSGFNSLLGGAQRYQAERSIAALLEKTEQSVNVIRDGRPAPVDVDEVVDGDVVVLEAGDAVPADCRILEAEYLEVDESSLTGESVLVPKSAEASYSPAVAERASMLYQGSYVAAGKALAVVVAIGENTEIGRTERAAGSSRPATGVEARLHQLTRWALPASGLGGGAVVATGLLRGRGMRNAVGTGVSLAVAAVPEGLPLLTTMAQLAAARRLSQRGALVRNPRAIEALGRVNVLCVDKTGTLTKGKIRLVAISDGRSEHVVGEESMSRPYRDVLAVALRASPPSRSDDVLPHPTDAAVVDGASQVGISTDECHPGWQRADELPFEPARGYHAVLGVSEGRTFLSVKGAPEIVLPRCARWTVSGERSRLDASARRHLDEEVSRLARRGLRVLAVAEAERPDRRQLDEDDIKDLDLVGFILLADPVRKTAAAAVAGLRDAGVEVVMVTGDHPSTAEGIAAELGVLDGRRILSGSELQELNDAALAEAVSDVSVFARVTPLDKVRIVRAFQQGGRAVAMTGDGANDAPAIRLADAGVAVGKRATPAARQAADVVVTNNKVETIVEAIIEGRGMWASVREALSILLGGNLGEMTFVIGGGLVTGQSPLSARQLLLVNLLTDVAPALAIAVRPPKSVSRQDLVREGPEASLAASLDRAIAVRAATTAAGAGGAWVVARMSGRRQRASTIALAALVGTQLGQTLWSGGFDPLVAAAGIGSAAILVGVVQTPILSQFFGCTPLGPVGWATAGVSAVAATATNAAVSTILRQQQDHGNGGAGVLGAPDEVDA
jgi:cation-transporting ATPase I